MNAWAMLGDRYLSNAQSKCLKQRKDQAISHIASYDSPWTKCTVFYEEKEGVI